MERSEKIQVGRDFPAARYLSFVQTGSTTVRQGKMRTGQREGGRGEGRVNRSHIYLVLRIDQMPLRPGLLGSFQCRILDCHSQAGVDG